MAKAVVEEQEKWRLPEGEPLPVVLLNVEDKTFEYPDKKTGEMKSFTKWTWEFEISDGDYSGLKIWADTDAKVTNGEGNKPREWAETLLGVELDLGEGLDTDDLLGLPATAILKNIVVKKSNGDPFYKSEMEQLLPADAASMEAPF